MDVFPFVMRNPMHNLFVYEPASFSGFTLTNAFALDEGININE